MNEQEAQHVNVPATTSGAAATIDSFSQLPFSRPTRDKPPPPPSGSSSTSIRLFGFDFPPDANAASTTANDGATTHAVTSSAASGGGGRGRKFECHYCCRNFPTSQALGGHQNAHKRERQHAKRAQFHTTMAMHGHYPPLHGPAHGVYGAFAGYQHYPRLGGAPSMANVEPPAPHYRSWSGASSLSSHIPPAPSFPPRYYGGAGFLSQPINGSPVPAASLWRVPGINTAASVARQERPTAFSLICGGGEESMVGERGEGVAVRTAGSLLSSSSSSSSSASPRERRGRDAPENRDNVSLDLTL